MVPQRFSCCDVRAVAFFGHGERDDFCFCSGDSRDDIRHLIRRKKHLSHAADHAPRVTVAGNSAHAVETILRRELIAGSTCFQTNCAYAPIAAVCRDRVVGVDGLMRAVKRAEAEVNLGIVLQESGRIDEALLTAASRLFTVDQEFASC